MTTLIASTRRVSQGVALIGMGLGLGIGGTFPLSQALIVLLLALFGCAMGGHMLLGALETQNRSRVNQGCGLIGFGLGLGMGGTFPDSWEWVTWTLCAFWCLMGFLLLRRSEA